MTRPNDPARVTPPTDRGTGVAQGSVVPPRTTAATRLLCLLGHPIDHSLSPALHSAAIAEAGIDAVYVALDVAPGGMPDAVAGLRALGCWGANVTIPHKQAALELADRATEEAAFIGAANTLFWDGDDLVADNTDAEGLRRVLTRDCDVGDGTDALVFGSGGAARAAVVALGRLGARIGVRARRGDAAAALEELGLQAGGQPPRETPPRLVVNATPLGRHGEPLPEEWMGLGPGRVALDLNYDGDSQFLASARAAGGQAVDGLGMLIGQAEAAFERWTGRPAPAGAMARAAATSAAATSAATARG